MRFYSEIRIEPDKHLDEICNNPYLVFSTDFIHYLTAFHDMAWCPIESKPGPYVPHPMSPCTKNVKKAMHHILVKSELNYELLYEELVPTEAGNKLELFIDRARSILSTLTDNPMSAFFAFLHLGRWTITFYANGTKDTVYLAPYLMANALETILENSSITLWFRKFDEIALDLAGVLRDEIANGFVEESYRFYEELEANSDDFDECTLCVCGHCEGLFEDCDEWDEEYSENSSDTINQEDDDYDLYDEYDSSTLESGEFSEDAEDEINQDDA